MKLELIDLVDSLETEDSFAAWQKSTEFFAQYGFHSTVFGMVDKCSSQLLGFHTNLDEDWVKHYMDMDYCATDPFAHHVVASHSSIIYSRNGHSELVVEKGSAGYKMLDEASSIGFESSYCIPVHNTYDSRITGFNIVSEMSDKELAKVLLQHKAEIELGAALINNRMIDIAVCAEAKMAWKPNPHCDMLITAREAEVLKWLSEGHRNDRIAEKMNIASVTVNFHLSEIRRKLGSKTREQSVAIAFKKGLLR